MSDGTDAPSRISIDDQIDEVEKEIRMRERVYPEWVKAGKYKGETANRKLEVMRRVARTLRWLKDNSDWIHEAHDVRREEASWQRQDAGQHPDVARVMTEFPGAAVVDVRPMEQGAE